ncbi:MAG: M23 family metallopeptidase [Rhodoferax sp.]
MQLIITDAWLAKRRPVHFTGASLAAFFLAGAFLLMLASAGMYHWIFLKGAREGWPVIGTLVRLVVRDEFAQRDRFLRENIEAMARRMGEMQAKLLQLESLGERVSSLAGVPVPDLKAAPGSGGPLVASRDLSLPQLQQVMDAMDDGTSVRADWLTAVESRLLEQKVKKMMLPTQHPVQGGNLGSPFGWRVDPITGQSALHTGLDFPAETGTPILAAAGGVVVVQESHPQYGNLVEIDHGNGLISRYAHSSRVYVKRGDLVKRGQRVADVGSSGRSTGAHLHFEVLVNGVPQDPMRFLNAGSRVAALK